MYVCTLAKLENPIYDGGPGNLFKVAVNLQ